MLKEARHALDSAKVYRLRMEVYQVSGRTGDAVTAAVEALKLFGVNIPDVDEDIQAATEAEFQQIPVISAPTDPEPVARHVERLERTRDTSYFVSQYLKRGVD